MAILLLRHAEAVHPHRWSGPDRERPLTPQGEASTHALAARWGTEPIARVLASPFPRCLATVGPLAQQLGLAVEPRDELAEGSGDSALELLQSLGDSGVVACTHGDVIPALLARLEAVGAVVPRPWLWPNVSTWRLETDDGWVVSATYHPPPGLA